jgi:hypothetical protein
MSNVKFINAKLKSALFKTRLVKTSFKIAARTGFVTRITKDCKKCQQMKLIIKIKIGQNI